MRRDFKKFPGEFFSTVGTFPKLVEVQHAFNTPQICPSSYDAAHAAASIVLRCIPSHSSGLVTSSFFFLSFLGMPSPVLWPLLRTARGVGDL